jgi:hypothetical protein
LYKVSLAGQNWSKTRIKLENNKKGALALRFVELAGESLDDGVLEEGWRMQGLNESRLAADAARRFQWDQV